MSDLYAQGNRKHHIKGRIPPGILRLVFRGVLSFKQCIERGFVKKRKANIEISEKVWANIRT